MAKIPGTGPTGLTAVNVSRTLEAMEVNINLYWYDPEDTGGSWIINQLRDPGRHRQGRSSRPSRTDDELAVD